MAPVCSHSRLDLCKLIVWLLASRILVGVPVQADIIIGQSALSGPLFPGAVGMAFAFNETNALGGINSQNVTLITLDDGYNATRALENVQQLVYQRGVLLLAGVVSSPAFVKILPFVAQNHVPLVGPITGVPLTRTPFVEEVINIRASYSDEIIYHLTFLIRYAWVKQVGILYQDDPFGQAGYALAVAGLEHVGLSLIAAGKHTAGLLNVEDALENLLNATPKLQAVILVTLQASAVKFIRLYKQDNRSDPACLFTLISVGSSSSVATQLTRQYWNNVFMFLPVPVPGDSRYPIAQYFATAFREAGFVPDIFSLEGYLIGCFIIQVLKKLSGAGNITRQMFLDEVYNAHLFNMGGLHFGLYSRNYTGCDDVLCSCNSGMRSVFVTTPDPITGEFIPELPVMTYPITQCSNTLSALLSPLLFGQLIPRDDPTWTTFALQIGMGVTAAFTDANAAGGLNGRQFILVQKEYSDYNVTANILSRAAVISRSSAKVSALPLSAAIVDINEDYPLLAFTGSVVDQSSYAQFPLPTIGTYDMQWDIDEHKFYAPDMRVQPSTPMEIMALVQFAIQQPHRPIHLRAPDTEKGRLTLANMVKTVHSAQRRPSSAKTYIGAQDALDGITEGWLLGVGEDRVVEQWLIALEDLPNVDLLTLSTIALHLLTSFNNTSVAQTKRLHFPSFNTATWDVPVQGEAAAEAYRYGYLLGHAVVQVMQHSEFAHSSYNTPDQLQSSWYASRLITFKTISLGSYSNENCTTINNVECQCNEGVRRVAIRTAASADVEYVYTSLTCHVTYQPLHDNTAIAGAIGGSIGGLSLIIGAMLLFILFSKRSNRTAPKDAKQPFCIIFTDIQSSTNLWATIPKEMTSALNTHHDIIRKLLAKHKCYEVKTIGDSFMCACRTPAQAMNFALALQQKFHEHNWGTRAIDAVYNEHKSADYRHDCWNGLRVRVGIHYGYGEIQVDPVSKGYDYYGTVVNIAARIEAVCHGGQIGVSDAVYDHLGADFPDVVWTDLGVQSLRGLSQPIQIYQALPAGPLTSRLFPPLRVDQAHNRELDVMFEMDDQCSVVSSGMGKDNVSPASSNVRHMEDWRWTEEHPLVLKGDITVEEIKSHYQILLTGFNTLLATQTQRFREQVIDGVCSRLHIQNYGAHGMSLQRTLRGLVHRVLPATVASSDASHMKSPKWDNHGKLHVDPLVVMPQKAEDIYVVEEEGEP